MIIIWRGAGGLVIIFGIISAVLANVFASSFSYEDSYFAHHAWLQALTLGLAGTLSWATGRVLNSRPGGPVTDPQTGQTMIQAPNHHLMFIKMEYWGPIYLAIAVLVLILGAIKR
ncbi:MAG TPA: hypothetical protein VKD91_22450 [Pyrinomonadaceae bacterium]|nr:hypothetical protein [Pyrinomonadaceae bacterium]